MERDFRRKNGKKILLQGRVAAILGLIMYTVFAILDVSILQIATPLTLTVRLLAVPAVFLLCLILLFTKTEHIEAVTILALTSAQIGHFVLIGTGAYPPEYGYGVTNIILLYLFTFSRIQFRTGLILGTSFIGVYQLLAIFHLGYGADQILAANFFLLSIFAVCLIAGYNIERYIRQEYLNQQELAESQRRSDELLLNILPRTVARELKERGITKPIHYSEVSVFFADFVGFTGYSESLAPGPLVAVLDRCFSHFDEITKIYNLEKIKTIGDAYMLAGGLPIENRTHSVESILAGMDFLRYIRQERAKNTNQPLIPHVRIGINTGPVIAGVLGSRKFAFDIFGRTVNIASRMEAGGEPNRINISESCYKRVSPFFRCRHRGIQTLKNNETYSMYSVTGIRPELSQAGEGQRPNLQFWKTLQEWSQDTGPDPQPLRPAETGRQPPEEPEELLPAE